MPLLRCALVRFLDHKKHIQEHKRHKAFPKALLVAFPKGLLVPFVVLCVLFVILSGFVLERDPRLLLHHQWTNEAIRFTAARHFDRDRQNARDATLQVEYVL